MSIRKINFEYLRILSIIMIIAFHCVYHGGMGRDNSFTLIRATGDMIYHLGELGVSCFFLISGYFLTDSTFRLRKVILLLLQVEFYVVISRLFLISFGQPVQWRLRDFFPVVDDEYWFIHVYLLVYILQPGLKNMLPSLGQNILLWILSTQVLVWSVLPTFILTPIFSLENTEAVPYYNRYIWFLLVYLIGYYIRQHGLPKPKKGTLHITEAPNWQFIALSFLLLFLAVLIGELEITPFNATYFWTPNSTLMLFMSISVFCAFKDWEPRHNSKWVRYIASCTLGTYLLHDGAIRPFLWEQLFAYQPNGEFGPYILQLMKVVILILTVGIIVDSVRKVIERRIVVPILDNIQNIAKRSGAI